MMCMTIVNAQSIKKDDLAHIEAGAVIHSGTYFAVTSLQEGKGKYWKPFLLVNVVGATKEIIDSTEKYNRFDWNDMALNNLGALMSLGLIEVGQAIGIPKNITVGTVIGISMISLGLTAQF